ncbi:MAG: hypothetical protein ACUVRJ_02345 [Candidatus Villigracilaceae bacterium]
MYHGFWEAVEGFTKNIFSVFDHHVLLYLAAWSWVALIFLLPPFVLAAHALGIPHPFYPYSLAMLAVAETLLMWSLAYKRFGFSVLGAWLYPITAMVFVLIALRSLVFTLTGQALWKERSLTPPVWRW